MKLLALRATRLMSLIVVDRLARTDLPTDEWCKDGITNGWVDLMDMLYYLPDNMTVYMAANFFDSLDRG